MSLLEQTAARVKAHHSGDSSGHDWWHIDRVRRVALRLAKEEGGNLFVAELAALLHDVGDWKFHDGDEQAGSRIAREWLMTHRVAEDVIAHVCSIVDEISFKGAGVNTDMPTIEGRCVQDADRLDAIGAIGVGRAFAFGGRFGRPMYDPDALPELHATFAAYKSKGGPTLNHFSEKLLLLKDRMQTVAGKRLAAARHDFLETFLQRFLAEWNGDA